MYSKLIQDSEVKQDSDIKGYRALKCYIDFCSRLKRDSEVKLENFPSVENITAEIGQNITLPCQAPNINVTDVLEWIRNDLEPDHVFLYRDGITHMEQLFPSFVNRVVAGGVRVAGNFSLSLMNVTSNDTGRYECRAGVRQIDGPITMTLISIINLSVVPPGPPGGHTEDTVSTLWGMRNHDALIACVSLIGLIVAGLWLFQNCKQNQRHSKGRQ